MNKDGQVKLGRTKCDKCEKCSTEVVGDRALCAEHAALVKNASGETVLRDAGIAFRDHHR